MKFARVQGLEALNIKLRDKYGEDLETLKSEYTHLMDMLTKYYSQVDPTKKNIEDIAAWAIVHGEQPLSERLEKRYGKTLFASMDETPMDAESLKSRLVLFYQLYETVPKNDSDLNTIVTWTMSTSVQALNKKLKEKYQASLEDLPPMEVGPSASGSPSPASKPAPIPAAPKVVATAPQIPVVAAAVVKEPKPEMLGTGVTVGPVRKTSVVSQTPAGKKGTPPNTPKVGALSETRERTDSFSSQAGDDSMDQMDNQMSHMRRITSGQYDNLAKTIRAFYRTYDPQKLENKEALDLVLKWTFKHGVPALNSKFNKHYQKTLDAVVVTEFDEEEDEKDDYVPDW